MYGYRTACQERRIVARELIDGDEDAFTALADLLISAAADLSGFQTDCKRRGFFILADSLQDRTADSHFLTIMGHKQGFVGKTVDPGENSAEGKNEDQA